MEIIKLPHDVHMECVYLIRGYNRRRKEYREQVEAIIGSPLPEYEDRVMNRSVSDPTYQKSAMIERLESTEEVKKMRAVQRALLHIEPELRAALVKNISDRRPFCALGVEGYSEMTFKRRRRKLICLVAKERGYF